MIALELYKIRVRERLAQVGLYANEDLQMTAHPFLWNEPGPHESAVLCEPTEGQLDFRLIHIQQARRQGQDFSTMTFELTTFLNEPSVAAQKRANMIYSALARDTGQRCVVEVLNDMAQDIIITRYSERYAAIQDFSTQRYIITWTADICNDYDYRDIVVPPPAERLILAPIINDIVFEDDDE